MHYRTTTNAKGMGANIKLRTPDKPPDNHDHLLREAEAAQFLGLSPRTMQQWRYAGYGPVHIRLTRRAVRYRMQDLLDFVDTLTRQNTIEE